MLWHTVHRNDILGCPGAVVTLSYLFIMLFINNVNLVFVILKISSGYQCYFEL